MALTTQERTNIIKLTVAMFNAAPGATYLADLTVAYEANGRSLAQLARTLTETSAYKALNPVFQTAAEFATAFLTPLGLQANAIAVDFVTAKFNAGVSKGQIAYEAAVALDASTDTAFADAKAILTNKTTVSEYYSVTKAIAQTNVGTLQQAISTVTKDASSVTTAQTNIDNGTTGSSGSSFTFTTGVDTLTGTSGADTFTADNTSTSKQLSAADTVNGGSGTDTLKVFLSTTDTAPGTPTLNSIEAIYLNGGVVTAYTAPTGTTSLQIDAAIQPAGTTYTLAGQTLSLANLKPGQATTTTIASATDTAETVTLNAVATGTTNTWLNSLDFAGTKVTTLNLKTETAASTVSLVNTGAAITTLNVSGDKNLSLTENAATALAITTISAATATGNVSINAAASLTAAAFKFTGGAGNDTITFIDNEFGTLTAGTQLDGGAGTADKIGLFDTAVSAAEAGKINAAVGFEVLGLNGAALTLDAASVSNFKQFSIDTTALTQTISNLATGSKTTIGVTSPTSLTLGTAVGVIDTSIAIGGSATQAATSVTTLVVTGITSIALSSVGAGLNQIGTLTNSDNSAITVTGSADLTFALSTGSAVGSKVDGSAFTGKLTVTGSGIAGSGDILLGGTGTDTIDGGLGNDTMTGGAGADSFVFTTGVNTSGAVFGTPDVITDFVVGTDKIRFSDTADVVSAQQVAVQAAVTALAAGSSASAIATAMATASDTAKGVSVATFGGNTYVLFEAATTQTGVVGTDAFIQLTGVASGFTFANSVVA